MSATACVGVTSPWYPGGNASRQIRNASSPSSSPRGDERVAQLVGPSARDRRELGLERGFVDLRGVGTRRLHHDVQPREHRITDEHGEVDLAPAERSLQHVEHRQSHLGRVAVAREVDQARHEAAEFVGAHEQAQPAPIAEAHDPEREPGETIGRETEHLVPRDRLEHVDQRSPPMTQRRRARTSEHRLDLPAHDGDRARRFAVDGGGVEPEEALLADDQAVRVETLDAHEVERHRAVHRRPFEHLREREDVRLRVLARKARRHAASPDRAERDTAGLVAGADEREMVVGEPFEERRGLADVFGIDGRRSRRAQLRREFERAATHRLPIGNDDTHVGDHRLDGRRERIENRSVALTVDLGVHEQGTVHDRTKQQVHLVAVARAARSRCRRRTGGRR